ncbi:LOW QUALITY PROTEIN: hypothetical protein ElyMa_000759300 [Elysia marginata]|uniref:Uncharacterized protein n=1 Tax=Elysia marginata TaxID=1093978 RepID=A0AAV4GTV9_9GAST|nr:LOW QUALITY PROTEIN: hypothetical protein ElyMa_000759300 [Elysia marginata]
MNFRLRTGHCQLRAHQYKMGISQTVILCECSKSQQTVHDFMQEWPQCKKEENNCGHKTLVSPKNLEEEEEEEEEDEEEQEDEEEEEEDEEEQEEEEEEGGGGGGGGEKEKEGGGEINNGDCTQKWKEAKRQANNKKEEKQCPTERADTAQRKKEWLEVEATS